MRAAGTHLAAVTGDQGQVIGFVTMEDVLGRAGRPGGRVSGSPWVAVVMRSATAR